MGRGDQARRLWPSLSDADKYFSPPVLRCSGTFFYLPILLLSVVGFFQTDESFASNQKKRDRQKRLAHPSKNQRFRMDDRRCTRYAPDDDPYLKARALVESPSQLMTRAALFQERGKLSEAEAILEKGKTEFPFARCEFSSSLAIVYHHTGRTERALEALEEVQPFVDQASSAECLRSQFLLGTLYQEMNRRDDAQAAFQKFLQNSEHSEDAQIKSLRHQLGAQ